MRKDRPVLIVTAFVVLTLACMAATPGAAQTTIHVPADQATIQAAINAAQAGDTVLVAPGTYFENLDFQGKAITVTSSDGPAVTIVDGGAKGPVATFQSGEGTDSVLNGFTLQNGVPPQTFPFTGTEGGGVLISLSSPTITNNVITGNHAICGIGMEIRGGSAVVRGNTITGNTQAFGDGGCGGGGIEITGDSSQPPATPQIIGNTITNNSLLGGGFGGGIEVSFFASPIIRNNYIAGNSVFNSGGGIDLESSTAPIVEQNIIVNNSAGAGGSGGGIYVLGPSSLAGAVVNNTIAGNTAFDGSSGIFANVIAPIPISNNIVVAAPGQTGIVCESFRTTFPTFSHNDVISPGGGQAWSSNCASNAGSNGNISSDPQFVNAASGDYHLQAGSPAIDAGDNSAPSLPQQDLDGNPRIAFGNSATCSNTVDMGAYEFVLTTTPSATLSPAALDFGGVAVGMASVAQNFTFTATQGCVAKPTIAVTGDFHEADNCSSVLGTGASCNIQVTFLPTAAGTRTGMLAVTAGNVSTTSNLTGQGQIAVATISPTSADFGSQPVNNTSATQVITLTSAGSVALEISGISVSGDFAQTNSCPAALAAGASCAISVRFTPTASGPRSGMLVVSTNGGVPSANLTGVGVDYALAASPATLSVKQGKQVQTRITVSSLGGSFGRVVALSCTNLPRGASCAFSPASVTPGTTSVFSTLTIGTQMSGGIKIARGTYSITVNGTSSGLVRSAVVTLAVQ